MTSKLILFLIVTVSTTSSFAIERTSIVETPSGSIQGILQNGAKIFYAIPFAAPPVGALRWKAPQLITRWEGLHAATDYAPSCMQQPQPGYKVSEDCLYLNVFVPANASSSSHLPVRVWIYGGGYNLGRTNDYPADLLAIKSNSIIVTISYRVNMFGFFSLPQLVSESPVLNYGLQDQQVALLWVQKNIESFGGDANNVLIFGESAGASSVGMHMLMKNSWPLYHKAVMESPGPWLFPSLETANSLCQGLVSTIPACNTTSPSELLTCLRGLSADEVLNSWVLASPKYGAGTAPCVDKQQLMDAPGKLFTEGKINPKVPLIVGSNLAEGNLLAWIEVSIVFNSTNMTLTQDEYHTIASIIVPPRFLPTVLGWYAPLAESSGHWLALSHLMGDLYINAGACIVANGAMKAGNPVFRYVFTESTIHSTFSFLNATHGSEMPYVFDNPAVFAANSFTPSEQALADRMVGYWTRFHQTGNPNGGSNAPDWPRYRMGFQRAMVLNEKPTTVSNWDEPWCSLWKPILQTVV